MNSDLDYVARKTCGCVVGWCSSRLTKRELAKETADWIRRGFSVERVTTDYARQNLKECKCDEMPAVPQPKQEVLF